MTTYFATGVTGFLGRRLLVADLAYRVFPDDSTPRLASVAAGLTRPVPRGLR